MTLRHALLPCLLAMLAACGADAPATGGTATPAADAAPAAAPARTAAPAAIGEVPVLRIATLDGAMFDLASRRGTWTVVNFWATWCAPCIKEMPDLDAFDKARADVGVIGLAYEEIAVEEMRAFLAQRPVSYPIALVDTYDPPAGFPTPRGLPMTYVIAPDGSIAKQFMGPVTQAELDAVVGPATPAKG